MTHPKEIPIDFARECLTYDPTTGVLRWKVRPGHHFSSRRSQRIWNTKFSGRKAGYLNRNARGKSYTRLQLAITSPVDGRRVVYSAHRVAWAIYTGQQPPEVIDHRNRDATDNRWENLRDGSEINAFNKSAPSNNRSGVVGVSWCRRGQKWQAHVEHRGEAV